MALSDEGTFPSLDGAVGWLNSPPLTRESLTGKVVVVDFWTYSCINCLRSIPYVEAWARKYQDAGLVVIGVHTPEFAFEKDSANVARALTDLGITYPVAIDSKYAIWNAFHNQYWPAHYFIDAKGIIRYHHFGEGSYDESEAVIQQLLREQGSPVNGTTPIKVAASGAQAPSDFRQVSSPETYLGYDRARNYASPQSVLRDAAQSYTVPSSLAINQWGLGGGWIVSGEDASLSKAPGKVVFRFHARDLHLVLGPGPTGSRFASGSRWTVPRRETIMAWTRIPRDRGPSTEYRLYQLVRQKGAVADRTFEIEFLDPGVQAFAFTFG